MAQLIYSSTDASCHPFAIRLNASKDEYDVYAILKDGTLVNVGEVPSDLATCPAFIGLSLYDASSDLVEAYWRHDRFGEDQDPSYDEEAEAYETGKV